MTFVLGLTGGIATGKSTADAFFIKHKIPVIDSDQIAHHIYDQGKPAYRALISEYGNNILDNKKEINRKKLGEIVFSDEEKLQELDSLTHPLICQEINDAINSYEDEKVPIVVLDAPVLYEAHNENVCDAVLVISLPEEIQVKRLMARNNYSKEEALERIRAQMPLQEKVHKANYVIENTGTIKELEEQLDKLLNRIKKEV